jgi:hypothetical protein
MLKSKYFGIELFVISKPINPKANIKLFVLIENSLGSYYRVVCAITDIYSLLNKPINALKKIPKNNMKRQIVKNPPANVS